MYQWQLYMEDYLARIKKDEYRYQALKAYAEEKLFQAHQDITQVRRKAKTEVVPIQVSVCKKQPPPLTPQSSC